MQYAKLGGTGNAALAGARASDQEGLVPSIYCHPVGYHGTPQATDRHDRLSDDVGPGSMSSAQHLALDRAERYTQGQEWGDQPVRFALEEERFRLRLGWIDGRQTQFYLIASRRRRSGPGSNSTDVARPSMASTVRDQ